MKKATSALLAAVLLAAAVPAPARAASSPFRDTIYHWAENDIRAAAAAGWVNGYPDGTFKPEGPVTRAEFLKMLAAVRGVDPGEVIGDQRLAFFYERLSDTRHWSVVIGSVKSAMVTGIMEPTDYTVKLNTQGQVDSWTFSPDSAITRLDAAVLITRALGNKYAAEDFWLHPGSRYSPARPEPQVPFTDTLAAWSKGWVKSASESGIIKGYPDGTFLGGQTVKRSEAVVMLRRLAATPQTPWRPLAMFEAPLTPGMISRDGLYQLDFNPMLTVRFDVGNTWAETAHAWAALSREYRAKTVEEFARRFWAETQTNGYFPFAVRGVTVKVVGQTNQDLGEGHFGGVTYEYLDVNGNATPVAPDTKINLRDHLYMVPGNEDLAAQYDRYLASARTAYQGNPPVPVLTYTFPYQYLGEWFRTNPDEVMAFARSRADEFYRATKPRLAAAGVDLKQVTFQIAPSDTADRAGQYRSLLIGETLLKNPVLTITYDGTTARVASRPASLREYTAGLTPKYEMVRAGEGWGTEQVDPAPAAARQMMETFLYTLGMKP
ncbi:MAG TPA: S-layer homology domain-containing protein [Symbiobacteriaceae bacterium]|nr:S-layer homology domain-containing protein [Symbiobacteriaceae bacterium]